MKKKVIKKKAIASVEAPSKDVEMPMGRVDDDEDVAEDYKVIDMSDIAAPVIEFELPNLGEKEIEKPVESGSEEVEEDVKEEATKKKKKDVKKKSPKKAAVGKKGDKEVLTAEKLNNELVRMRASVVKGRARLMGKLVRQKKQLETKKEGKKKEEVERKVARLGEEIVGLKAIDKDTVAKFAALNTKSLEELKIDGKTSVAERLLYKLACQDVVVEAVESIREKYIEWNKTAAFFMQRLGLQYANKPDKKTEKKVAKKEEDEEDHGSGAESAGEEEGGEEEEGEEQEVVESGEEGDGGDYNESDVEMVDSDEEAGTEAAQNRRNLLLGLIGVKEDKSRPALKPKKRKIDDADDDVIQKKTKTKEAVKNEMKQVLEKELKTNEVPMSNPNGKKSVAQKKKVAASAKKVEDAKAEEVQEETPDEDDSALTTLVMRVDLSKGGKISKTTPKPAAKAKAPQPTAVAEDEESDDESAAFFLPKTDVPLKKTKGAPKRTTVVVKAAAPDRNTKPETALSVEKKKGSSKKSVTSGEMHPSWAASQLKKKEMQSAKPCGKKITFGDDDD